MPYVLCILYLFKVFHPIILCLSKNIESKGNYIAKHVNILKYDLSSKHRTSRKQKLFLTLSAVLSLFQMCLSGVAMALRVTTTGVSYLLNRCERAPPTQLPLMTGIHLLSAAFTRSWESQASGIYTAVTAVTKLIFW